MERQTPIFIVCSPRPRVGKTLLARALAEFFRADERPVAAFDVNPDEFSLVDYLPAYTAVASVADTRDQVALFEQILAVDRVPKVIDLGNTMFDRFFTVIREIGFAAEAGRRDIVPVVLFIGDASRGSKRGYLILRDRFPGLPLVPVINESLPQSVVFRDDYPPTRHGGGPLVMPIISPMLRGVVERPSFSFAALSATARDRTTELYGWTRRLFLQFRELELRLLLEELRPALRFSA